MSAVVMVVPCYNEAERLQVGRFHNFACNRHAVRFLFVNDGSSDDTRRMLRDLQAAAPPRFMLHDLPRNVGKAEAVRTGVLRALASNPDYIGYWDADLAAPLDLGVPLIRPAGRR